MTGWYILDSERQVVGPVTSHESWEWLQAELARTGQRLPTGTLQVRVDQVDGHTVSTVFIGMDHNFGDGPPAVFETMTFGDPYEQLCWRYATWADAVAGHERVAAAIRDGTSLPDD